MMLEFREPVLADKSKIDSILRNSMYEGSFYTFAAIYTWAHRYKTKIAFYEDSLLISGCSDALGMYFLYPVGNGNLQDMIRIMKTEAHNNNALLKIIAESCQVKDLYRLLSSEYTTEDSRDDWDYVYKTEDLAFLKGNRYHNKRNHISRLAKKFADSDFTLEPITTENINECKQIEEIWVQSKNDDFDQVSVIRSLDNMKELGLSGGLLRIDGKPIAFTVGEPLLDDTFIIHIEKALPGYDGAYQMINKMFAETLVGKYEFINREEDMGIDGLRTSKLSYLPCKMIEKCVITERK